MNYTDLKTAIKDYTQNYETTFIAELPVFITQAEQRSYNSVQFPSLRKNVTGNITASNKYLSCPTDYLSTYSLAIYPQTGTTGSFLYLINKDVNYMREAYPDPSVTGQPKYYAIFGPNSANINELTFIIGPTPNSNYSAELHYFYYPESITTVSTGQTWLGDNFDSVLLYGSLLEAGTFMKSDPDIMGVYKQRYDEAMGLLKRLGDGLERGDAYRNGQTKLNTNLRGNVVA